VPLLAAIGGVLFVTEDISVRLIFSTVLILGGIFIVIFSRNHFTQAR